MQRARYGRTSLPLRPTTSTRTAATKLAVELSMTMHVIAAQGGIEDETLARLRGYCVDEVKKLGGKISFDRAWEHQRS